MATPYDEIAYPTTAFRQTHPERLATHAALFGLPYAPVAACRVLDIGCGDGLNIIAMAVAYPASRFVGFDLSQVAIARGRELIAALGLTNVRLEAADVMLADFGAAAFDYVIAHGLYAWIPDTAREALMASIRHHLTPDGVAFVSHNALPGAAARVVVRDMLRFHLRGVTNPGERTAAALARVKEFVETYDRDHPFEQLVKLESRGLLNRPPNVVAHDELGEVYHPVYLHEFVSHAAAHRLQFLTEAQPNRCGEGFLPPYALDKPEFDVVSHAQELDFKALRVYRENLVVHADVVLNRRPEPSRLRALFISGMAEPVEDGVYDAGEVRFELKDATLQAAIQRMSEAWPQALPIAELIDDDERAAVLLRLYWLGIFHLHTAPMPFTIEIGERPTASPLARLQAARGQPRLVTLRHTVAEITDETGQRFITRLDGSRTIDDLVAEMADVLPPQRDKAKATLLNKLNEMARLPLLVQNATIARPSPSGAV